MRYYIYFTNGSVIEVLPDLTETDFITAHNCDPAVLKIVRKKDNEVIWQKPSD